MNDIKKPGGVMFHVVKDVKSVYGAPYVTAIPGSTEKTIFEALVMAEIYATEHAADIGVAPPYRMGNGFVLLTHTGSVITYRAEEV